MVPLKPRAWHKGKGVVAAGHELTARAAAEILQDGGNAFDAALAGIFMTFVAEAVFSSPGGGGFLMARRAGRDDATLLDFFAETPLKRRPASEVSFYPIYADFGPAKQEFHIGPGSSATPGVVPGLFAMHEALCTLPMKRLVEPAVRAARQGFPLTDFQAYLFTVIAPILTASQGVARIFAPDGKPMIAGTTFRNEELAETLEWLAEDGARLFIDGDVGKAIVAQSRDQGGYLTHDDLARYRVAWREPLYWRHGDATVALNPPPAASGALIAFGLGFLAALASTVAHSMRSRCVPPWKRPTKPARTTARPSRRGSPRAISPKRSGQAARHPAAYRGTTHVSVIDAEGNAAAISLSNGEGNGYLVGKFGFMLNNMLGEEDIASGALGDWRAGTRLSSMMAPTIILQKDGTVTALGTGGSNRIRTAILQVAVNLLDRGMSLEAGGRGAAASCRARRQDELRAGLHRARGTRAACLGRDTCMPGLRGICSSAGCMPRGVTPKGGVEGAGDPRRQGVALIV